MLSITSISPTNEATQVSLTPTITITFNTNINPATVDEGSVVLAEIGVVTVELELTDGGLGTQSIYDVIDGTITVNNNTITFVPNISLKLATDYSVLISTNIQNNSAESLSSIYTSLFTTTTTTNTVQNNTSVNLVTSNANLGDTKFRITSISPNVNKVIKAYDGDTQFKFSFSENIDATTVASAVEVSYEGMLDDEEEIIEDVSLVVTNNLLTIKTNDYTSVPNNSIITIRFLGSLASSNGKFLDPATHNFILSTTSFYLPIKLFKLKAGQLISNIPDITLVALITYYSQEIDFINDKSCMAIPDPIKQAYAFYHTLYHLLTTTNQAPANFIKKGLGDFIIEVGNKLQADIFNRCLNDTRTALDMLKLYITTNCGNNLFVKSISHFDYPGNIGRNTYNEYSGPGVWKVREAGSNRSKWISE